MKKSILAAAICGAALIGTATPAQAFWEVVWINPDGGGEMPLYRNNYASPYLNDPGYVQPNSPGWITVWGGAVGQPGQPLYSYRIPGTTGLPPGAAMALTGAVVSIAGGFMPPPWGPALSIVGATAQGIGTYEAAQATMTTPGPIVWHPASGRRYVETGIARVTPLRKSTPGDGPPPGACGSDAAEGPQTDLVVCTGAIGGAEF